MIPLINQAIAIGYTASQVLSYISKKYKGMNKAINEAKSSGYDENQILKYLGGAMNAKNPNIERLSPKEKALKGGGHLTREEREERNKRYLSGTLKAAATAYAAYQGYRTFGRPSRGTIEALGADEGLTGPTSEDDLTLSPEPGPADQAAAPTIETPPTTTPPNFIKRVMGDRAIDEIPEHKMREANFLASSLDRLEKEGKKWSDPAVLKLRKRLSNLIGDKGLVNEEIARFHEDYPQHTQDKEISEQPSNTMLTPTGDMAKILDSPGKTSKVEIEGNKHIFNTEDLVPIPENALEIEELYEQLLGRIPEGQKSRMADYVGYDATNNALQVIFHDGGSYVYEDVPENIVKEIVESQFMAKTSGENYIGKWYKDAPSIGAGISLLIKDLQGARDGKGNEYSRKFKELYSLHRYPKTLLKKKKDEEKKRKKAKT
jgi:hypothetical protein